MSQFLLSHILSPFHSVREFGLVKSFTAEKFWLKRFALTSSNALLLREVVEVKVSDISGVFIILGGERENFYVLRKEN